ncbi:MAG: hypothetical protein IT353_05515, partial [Gemmatimonadaceae bacterium]|nr:hypothetical protein [Gemmatimonadaceae bacterium]
MLTRTAPSSQLDRIPLLTVHGGHAETHAGGVTSSIRIRALDNVSVAIHEGELVVLQGGVASGATTLFGVMCGERMLAAGVRSVAPDVRIQRATISAQAFAAIQGAWSVPRVPMTRRDDAAPPRGEVVRALHGAPRPLVLLRVRSQPHSRTHYAAPIMMHSTWQAWAQVVRARGGAIVACVAIPPARDARHVARVRAVTRAQRVVTRADAQPTADHAPKSPASRAGARSARVSEASLSEPYRIVRSATRSSSRAAIAEGPW